MLLAAALLPGNAYRWGALVLLALASAPWRMRPANALSAITVLYCAWLFASAVFITPTYSSEGIYRPLILLGAFVAVAALTDESRTQLFSACVAVIAVLVLLGLLQYLLGVWRLADNPTRAAATFVTPNTFATAINLFLLPLAAAYLSGHGSRRILALLLWLFAGLVASQSRGGMLAFLAGLAFIAVCIRLPAIWQDRKRSLHLLVGLTAVWILVVSAPSLVTLFGVFDNAIGPAFFRGFEKAGDSSIFSGFDIVGGLSSMTRLSLEGADRREIYAATLGLILDHPFSGAGANMFYPLFETVKPESLQSAVYVFVHNDYLQHWIEFGMPGLLLLLALAVAALVVACRFNARASGIAPLMCGAALASCFAHAMVDFPLFVPFILMIVGGYLGTLAAHIGDSPRAGKSTRSVAGDGAMLPLSIRCALVVSALAWTSQPVLADVAGQKAVAELLEGRPNRALHWQSVARRLEPRNGMHYWTEAVIWRDQAVEARDAVFAEKADMLFAEGMRADPYQIANFLGRAQLHRKHSNLFVHSPSPQKLLEWTAEALRLRPHSLIAQAEHARALSFAGDEAAARQIVNKMLEQRPETEMAQGLAKEFGLRGTNRGAR